MLIARYILCALVGLLSLSVAPDEEVEDAIAEGRRRLAGIPDPAHQTDSQVNCDFGAYRHEPYIPDANPYVRQILERANIHLGSPWQRVDVSYPPTVTPAGNAPIKFLCYYNPDGAIVYFDIARRDAKPNDPPYSAADVSWTEFKRVSDAFGGTHDYTGIKYIIHVGVDSDNSEEVFDEILDGSTDVLTITDPKSNEFLALLGLANGATVAGLLRGHNQEMGGKRIQSVKAFAENGGVERHIIWVLE